MEYKSLERGKAFSRSPSLLERSPFSLDQNQDGSSLQKQVDDWVEGFVHSAIDWRSLTAMTAGGMACRLGRLGGTGFGSGNVARVFSIGAGLGAEVSAFELTHRALHSVGARLPRPQFGSNGRGGETPPLPLNPSHLWKWSGPGGLKQGWLSSFISFGALKGFGKVSQAQNIILQHGGQAAGMVLGHQVSYRTGIGPKPEGTLAEQFLRAEATNLQLGAGMALVHRFAPAIQGLERGLDLFNRLEGPSQRANPFLTAGFATEGGPSFRPDLHPSKALSFPIKELKGSFRGWLDGVLSFTRGPKPPIKEEERLSEEEAESLAESIVKNLNRKGIDASADLKKDGLRARLALLQTDDFFVDRLEKSLEGFSRPSNLFERFFISVLGWEKIPEPQWPLNPRSISKGQIENVFLWPAFHRLASHPAFKLKKFAWSDFSHFPYTPLLEEVILTLDALKWEGSWGPPCDVTSFPFRNHSLNHVIIKSLLPLLKTGDAPLKVLTAGDSLGLNGLEIMFHLNRAGYGNIEVVSTDILEREIYYLYHQERIAVFDKKGNLLLLKKGGEIHSQRNPPSGKEARDLKRLFNNFDLRSEEDVFEDGDVRLQRIRLVDPRVGEILKKNPANFRLATADMMDSESLSSALQGRADLVLLFNVINRKRFSKKKARRALQSLGTGLKEGGFLAVGFREGLYSGGISTLNLFQRKGNQLIRLSSPLNPFSTDSATDFESLPLK